MDITKLSDNGLRSLHDGIRKAALADAQNPNQDDPYYGVKDFADWRDWCDALEAEFARRKLPFVPVKF